MSCPFESLTLLDARLDTSATATVIISAKTLAAYNVYKIRYLVKWSGARGNEILQIQNGATNSTPVPETYPVYTPEGVGATIGRIRRRELLLLKFVPATTAPVATPAHFVVLNQLYPQAIVIPNPVVVNLSGVTPNPPSQTETQSASQ